MSDPEAYQITTIIITTIIINYRAINFADELWSAIKGEVLAHPPSPFEQKMKDQSNSDFQNQKSMAFGFLKKGNQLNYEPKAEINSDFQTALTCRSSYILLINLIS